MAVAGPLALAVLMLVACSTTPPPRPAPQAEMVAAAEAVLVHAADPSPAPLGAAIVVPPPDSTASGIVTVSMSAESPKGTPITFTLFVDDAQVFTTAGRAPTSSFEWNTASLVPGMHTLTLGVRDGAGRTATATRKVMVAGASVEQLRVLVTAPAEGTTVSGTAWVTVWAREAASGPKTYTLREGASTITTTTSASAGPVVLSWPTAAGGNGPRTITTTVRDTVGAIGSETRTFIVQNPAPEVSAIRVTISLPSAGSVVRGTVWFTVSAEGASGATTYTLAQAGRLGQTGATIASTTVSRGGTALLAWPTRSRDNGAHLVLASVRDAAGRTGTTAVSLTVKN